MNKSVTVNLAAADAQENPSTTAPPDMSMSNGAVAAISHLSSDHLTFDIDAKAVGTATILADGQATPFPENLRAKTQFVVTVIGGTADHYNATISAQHDPQP